MHEHEEENDMKRKFNIAKEKRNDMISSIKNYFYNERDEEIGDLGASLVLDFFMEELADEFYNQGIQDSYNYFSDRVEDLMGLQK